MFVDQVKIYAQAGDGGNGCVAFQRDKFRPKGGPSGGDGGKGGDVILEASSDLNNLVAQFYVPRLIAKKGIQGMGKGKTGKSGRNLVIKVPCGTMVWALRPAGTPARLEKSESLAADPIEDDEGPAPGIRQFGSDRALEINLEEETHVAPVKPKATQPELVADLTDHGQRRVLCRGGRGGRGNRHFANSTRQTPRFAEPGEAGEGGDFRLDLRLIADAGLVGYPNAGKSTLINAISAARPKIAAYPFTTLHPQIGVVYFSDYYRLTVCDIPGIIEGAHQNVGLGHAFLRHITRCRTLVVVVDMAGIDERKPWDDYCHIMEELELYDATLLGKNRQVVANKMDVSNAKAHLRIFKARFPGLEVIPISAVLGQGLNDLKARLRKSVTPAQ